MLILATIGAMILVGVARVVWFELRLATAAESWI